MCFVIMSFPVYNTVQNPTSTLIIKWSRKGKTTIPDENALVGCFPNPLPKVVSFAAKCFIIVNTN